MFNQLKSFVPQIVQLTLTKKCQFNCLYCGVSFQRHIDKNTELSLQEIKEIISDLKISGCKTIDLFGGEPTLRKDFFQIVKQIKLAGFQLCLETNGFLLERDFLNRLSKAGIDFIYLNLSDYRADYHDRVVRRAGAFAKAVKALNICRELQIKIHTTIVPMNKEYFSEGHINRYIEFCLKQGAEKIRVLFPSCIGNWTEKEQNQFSEEDEREVVRYIDKQYHQLVYIEAENSSALGERTICSAMTVFCHITANGMVMPCPYLPFIFGDIKRESLINIVHRIMNHPYMHKDDAYCPSRDDSCVLMSPSRIAVSSST